MRYNYFLGLLLALIFPGLIQLYTGEKSKAVGYVCFYLLSFVLVFLGLTFNDYYIDIHNLSSILNDPLLINISLTINIVFRLLSGVDGLIQIHKVRKNLF